LGSSAAKQGPSPTATCHRSAAAAAGVLAPMGTRCRRWHTVLMAHEADADGINGQHGGGGASQCGGPPVPAVSASLEDPGGTEVLGKVR